MCFAIANYNREINFSCKKILKICITELVFIAFLFTMKQDYVKIRNLWLSKCCWIWYTFLFFCSFVNYFQFSRLSLLLSLSWHSKAECGSAITIPSPLFHDVLAGSFTVVWNVVHWWITNALLGGRNRERNIWL